MKSAINPPGFRPLLAGLLGGLLLSGRLMAQTAAEPAAVVPPAALDARHGLLWQIDTPGGVTSHLFGTIHLGDPLVSQLPSPVQRVFDDAEQLVVEVVTRPGDYLEVARRMALTGNERLPDLIGQSLYARVLHAAHGRDIDQQLLRLKPWAVATLLFTPRPSGRPVLDQQLALDARAVGKPVVGLETLEEQIAVFDDMALEQQVEFLHESVLASLEFDVYLGELLVAYMNRNLDQLVRLSGLHLAQRPRLKKILQGRLLDDRNNRMVERLLPILQSGNAFVAVGALHLPGQLGLLQQLQDRGYRVTKRY
ncbi:MAG: TraB/GumN family protein [Gammaproteobacteria bacterium]